MQISYPTRKEEDMVRSDLRCECARKECPHWKGVILEPVPGKTFGQLNTELHDDYPFNEEIPGARSIICNDFVPDGMFLHVVRGRWKIYSTKQKSDFMYP